MTGERVPPPENVSRPKTTGRTWADVFSNSVFLTLGIGLFLLVLFFGRSFVAAIPLWLLFSVAVSFLWTPWLIQRAKEGARLVLVSDGPLSLAEWRMGRNYPLKIEGRPLLFTSPSGSVSRQFLTGFNAEEKTAKGSALAGGTVFDLARDVNAFHNLAEDFSKHLRAERITAETVGVEVEKKISEASSRWLSLLYGSLDLSELESIIQPAEVLSPANVPPDESGLYAEGEPLE